MHPQASLSKSSSFATCRCSAKLALKAATAATRRISRVPPALAGPYRKMLGRDYLSLALLENEARAGHGARRNALASLRGPPDPPRRFVPRWASLRRARSR